MVESPDVSVPALRRLAQGLLYDRHGAEDVVQEAWLAALGAQPPEPRLGAWLTEAVKRLAHNRRREASRRRAREESAARAEELPGADERAAQLEILHRLLDALARLDEPYRAAVMLRYLDDQPPREIARRLGLPVNTARTHVRRGLERLRRDLDARGQGREELLAALVPFAGEVPWSAASPLGGQVWLAAATAFVLGVVWFSLRSAPHDERELAGATAPSGSMAGDPSAGSGSELELAPGQPNEREPLGAVTAAMNGTWILRGHAFGGDEEEPFPHLPLVGRVYSGPKAEGVPLLEERFATDDAGDYAWAIAPPAELVTVSIDAEIRDYLHESTERVFVPGDSAPEDWTVSARPLDTTIRGRVCDSDGRPVPHPRVQSLQGVEAKGDESGRYSLRVSSHLHFPWFPWEQELIASAAGFAEERFKVDPSSAGEIQAPDVLLRPDLRVHGLVVDESGAPISGVKIGSEYWLSAPAVSDETGAFELGGLDPQEQTHSFSATKQGYAQLHARLETGKIPPTVELRLQRSVRITGQVLDHHRAPIWGARITVGDGPNEGAFDELPRSGYSDQDGRFELQNVAPGRQRFWIDRPVQRSIERSIPSGVETFEVELALEEPVDEGHFLGGIVLDERGAPAPWLQVEVAPERPLMSNDLGVTYSGAKGRFRFDRLPQRRMLVRVHVRGLQRIEQSVSTLDRDDLVLQLKPTSWLAGRVLEEGTGAPVRAFEVCAVPPTPELWNESRPHVMSYPQRFFQPADGSWRLETEFEPGQPFSLTVEAPGYATSSVPLVRSTSVAAPDELVIRMSTATWVRGRVIEKDSGAPLAEARLRRITEHQQLEYLHNSPQVFETQTEGDGRFELQGVPTGEMWLAVEAADHALTIDGPFVVTGSTPIERVIEIGAGATLGGRLLTSNGDVLGGEDVWLKAWDGFQQGRKWKSTTDMDGLFRFEHLPSGSFGLKWLRYEGEKWRYEIGQTIEISSDDDVDTLLQPSGQATLLGTLEFDGDVSEADYVSVHAIAGEPLDADRELWARSYWDAVIEDGRFRLEHLEPGEYEVSVEFRLGVDPSDPMDEGEAAVYGEARVVVPAEGTVEVRLRLERHDF